MFEFKSETPWISNLIALIQGRKQVTRPTILHQLRGDGEETMCYWEFTDLITNDVIGKGDSSLIELSHWYSNFFIDIF